jgi:hypothetical protein
LKSYIKHYEKWIKELKTNDIYKFDPTEYRSRKAHVFKIFDDIYKSKYVESSNLDSKIGQTEAKWINGAYNSGIKYCNKGYKGKSYAFDYSFNYPKIMSTKSFMFPTKRGKEGFIKEVPTDPYKLEHGFYRLKVTCHDKNFKKIFSFSDEHIYLHESIKYVIMYGKQFNAKLSIIDDGEPNTYFYDKECLVSGYKVFGPWFEIMTKLKKAFPKNAIVKEYASQLHGVLMTRNKINVGDDEIDNYDWQNPTSNDTAEYIRVDVKVRGSEKYHVLVNRTRPFKYNFRLSSWIHAHARNKIARLALLDIDNVIRINVDCCVFSKDVVSKLDKTDPRNSKYDLSSLKLEDKYTGFGIWHHISNFEVIN